MDRKDLEGLISKERAQPSVQSGKPEEYWPDPRQQQIGQRFFHAMHRMYRNRWESQEGLPTVKNPETEEETYTENFLLWTKRLAEMKPEKIKHGLDYCAKLLREGAKGTGTTWPPTIEEFMGYCSADANDVGLPDPERAFTIAMIEAGKGSEVRRWPHNAIYLAAIAVGLYELRQAGEQNKSALKILKDRFFIEYESVVKRVISGEDVGPAPVKKIEPVSYKKNKPVGCKAAANIMSMFDE